MRKRTAFCRSFLSRWTEAEYAKALKRRKELYEALHPETKRGIAGGKASGESRRGENRTNGKMPFVQDTAARIGKSRSTVERSVALAEKLDDQAVDGSRAGGGRPGGHPGRAISPGLAISTEALGACRLQTTFCRLQRGPRRASHEAPTLPLGAVTRCDRTSHPLVPRGERTERQFVVQSARD